MNAEQNRHSRLPLIMRANVTTEEVIDLAAKVQTLHSENAELRAGTYNFSQRIKQENQMTSPFLSEAQFSVMEKIDKSNGQPIRLTSRMTRTVKKLEELGLVKWTYDVQACAHRGRHKLVLVVTRSNITPNAESRQRKSARGSDAK